MLEIMSNESKKCIVYIFHLKTGTKIQFCHYSSGRVYEWMDCVNDNHLSKEFITICDQTDKHCFSFKSADVDFIEFRKLSDSEIPPEPECCVLN
jgi:hypothetical protein